MTTPTAEQTETREELPCIFGPKGELIELTDEQASKLSEEAYQRYAHIADAYDGVLVVEKKIADCEAELHATVGELREAEQAVAALPKPSHVDLVRQMARQTAGHE